MYIYGSYRLALGVRGIGASLGKSKLSLRVHESATTNQILHLVQHPDQHRQATRWLIIAVSLPGLCSISLNSGSEKVLLLIFCEQCTYQVICVALLWAARCSAPFSLIAWKGSFCPGRTGGRLSGTAIAAKLLDWPWRVHPLQQGLGCYGLHFRLSSWLPSRQQ